MQQLIVCEGISWPNGIRRSGGYIITPSPIIHRTDTSPNTGKVIVDYREKILHTIDISYQVMTDAEYQLIYGSLKDMVSLQITYWDYSEKIFRTGTFYAPNFVRAEPMAAPNEGTYENVSVRLEAMEAITF